MTDVYAPPAVSLASGADTADTALLSFSGRIGRVRWFGYTSTGLVVSVLALMFLASRVPSGYPGLISATLWCAMLAVIAIICIMAMRRLHDLGMPRLRVLSCCCLASICISCSCWRSAPASLAPIRMARFRGPMTVQPICCACRRCPSWRPCTTSSCVLLTLRGSC